MSYEGARVVRSCPLEEHPRPQAKRKDVFILNGEWDFEINKNKDIPASFEKKILVPFAVETELSGITQRVAKDDFLHYHRTFDIPEGLEHKIAILHFDAVDQIADVFVNGELVAHHEGGYTPFIAKLKGLKQTGNVIDVTVSDDTDSEISTLI